ncbi:Short chain dehydrogenase citE like protein [Verticillium longisporum]|uniref:Short chain dehydrogenase citE like protein n=1 Tax=Verticillium longisporum TaxID=100787 RepID=A0A8I2ZGK5_VERLO|nr:Short chain dehydrogenase citE like protein [Verticillium longisporum]
MAAQPPSAPRDFTRTRHSSYDLISPLKLDLSGKYAVATGAAWDTGVGFATAKAFARTSSRLRKKQDETNKLAAYDKVVAAFSGRLDVLVNNAAHMEPYERFLDADPDIYWRTWQVNLGGLFNMARAVLPMMLSARESGDGLCTMMKSAIIEEDKVKLKMAF